jgi:hypothetical protein
MPLRTYFAGSAYDEIYTNGTPGNVLVIDADGKITHQALAVGSGNFADNETPSGTINGSNTNFTLANTPNPAASLQLQLGGIFLTQGVDYTLSGATITFLAAPDASLSGQPFKAFYRY